MMSFRTRIRERVVAGAAVMAASVLPGVASDSARAGDPAAPSSGAGGSFTASPWAGSSNRWISSPASNGPVVDGGGAGGGSGIGLGGVGAVGGGPIIIAPAPAFGYGYGFGFGYGSGIGFGSGYVSTDGYVPTPFPTGPRPMAPFAPAPASTSQARGLPTPRVDRPQAPPRGNPAKARELVEIGDRSFRGDSTKRAEDRYRQALKADPNSAVPRIRLAQLALVRGKYEEAARLIREAINVEPGYLLNAPDIQKLYGEPANFARELASLERHLQSNPGDRDAWFLLGAEWYLSGRVQRAGDAFLRLTDRRPDPALAVFLDATKTAPPAAVPR